MEQLKKQEYFEMAFNVDDSRLSVEDLITYLENINELFKSINDSMNRSYGIIYNSVNLDVLALDKGSFKIKFTIIKKTLAENMRNLIIGAIASMMGELVIELLNGPQININTDKPINRSEIMENEKSIKSVVNIINTALSDEHINGITITYEPIEGKSEKLTLSREALETSRNAYHEMYGKRVWLKEKVEMKILENKGYYLICEIEGDRLVLIDIDNFLLKQIEEINSSLLERYQLAERVRKYNLSPGETLIVDLECKLEQNYNREVNTKYSILKVYGFNTQDDYIIT